VSGLAPYAAATGAILAAEWIARRNRPTTDLPTTPAKGYDAARATAARAPLCGAKRVTEGYDDHEIHQDAAGGTDFLREVTIQRNSLLAAFGGLSLDLFRRPSISARCAREWLGTWLDAWQTAHRADRRAFAVFKPWTLPGASALDFEPATWAELWPDHAGLSGLPLERNALGKAVEACKALWTTAGLSMLIPGYGDSRPWLFARATTEALYDLARRLDEAGLGHGDAEAEALAELEHALSPGGVAAKAADVVSGAVEVAVDKVVAPATGALLGVIAPYAVLGVAIYVVAKRRAA